MNIHQLKSRTIMMDDSLWEDLICFSKKHYSEDRKISLFIRMILKKEVDKLKMVDGKPIE